MKQPDLGKKISDLRLSKGLTQLELANRSNVSLRTIQRIESAEVTPRSYTVKIIFDALDAKFYSVNSNSIFVRFANTWNRFMDWLIVLFNLKSNTMKKLTFLSLSFVVILLMIGISAKAVNKSKIRKDFELVSSNSMFMRCFNTGELDSLAMLYADDVCSMPEQTLALQGKEAVMARMYELYNTGSRFTELKVETIVQEGKLGFEKGKYTLKMLNGQIMVSGNYITQYRYIDGHWKIENEMSTVYPLNLKR